MAGLVDEVAMAQLAALRYQHNARGQVVIEAKDEARKRGVPSPDRAESLMLAFADRTPGIIRYYEEQNRRATMPEQTLNDPAVPELHADASTDELSKVYEDALREFAEEDER